MSQHRADSLDVLKGLGISFVILNHCFTRGARKFLGSDVTEDALLYGINRAIHFAVPVFLFVSALLLAKSFDRKRDWKAYVSARWEKTVIPFLVASVFYYLFDMVTSRQAPDLYDGFVRVLTGKAYFHLYFTIVLIQVSVVVPLMILAMRGWRPPWWQALVIGATLQLGFYELQRLAFHWDRPGSVFVWYLVPLFLGVALSRSHLHGRKETYLAAALIFGGAYVATSLGDLVRFPTSSDAINLSYVLYTGFLAMALWLAVPDWPGGRLRDWLRRLGQVSLPVFLVHPALMYYLGGPRLSDWLAQVPGAIVAYWAVSYFGSYGLALLILRTRIGRWVMGLRAETASQPR